LGDEGDGENTKEVVVRISSLEGNPSLLKEVREKKIKSREEKEELVETEDVVHLGDISDKVSKQYIIISSLTYSFTHSKIYVTLSHSINGYQFSIIKVYKSMTIV